MQSTTLLPTSRSGLLRKRVAEPVLAPVVQAPPQAATADAGKAPEPDALFEATNEVALEACVTRRFNDVAEAAKILLPHRLLGGPRETIIRMLAECTPAAIEQPVDDQPWMLQRLDGTVVGLVRLRDNGEVSNAAHANESRWEMRDGCLLLCDPRGKPTTAFTLGAQWAGKRVLVGLFMDNKTVHVLSQMDCAYSRLRSLDPELIAPFSGVFLPREMANPTLPEKPTLILASPRTGSHLLLNMLNSSNRAFFDAELMNPMHISIFGTDLKPEKAGALYGLRANDPIHFLKVMLSRSHHDDGMRLDHIGLRGFKLFPGQSQPALDWALNEQAFSIVHLHRANLLAEYSSALVAFAEGHWVGGPATLRNHRIPFHAQRFLRFVDMKRRYLGDLRDKLVKRGGKVIEIEYSGINNQSVNNVLTYLLDEPNNIELNKLGIERQLNARVIDRFDNPDDVKRCLEAIGRESWADIEQPEA